MSGKMSRSFDNPNYQQDTISTRSQAESQVPIFGIASENATINSEENVLGSSGEAKLHKYPPAAPPKPKGTSDLETLMHMIKANIGTGVLAMPLAFKNGGLALSAVWLWIMAIICIHCMHILLNCYKHVMVDYLKQNEDGGKLTGNIGYDDVVMLVARSKCAPNSRWPKIVRLVVSIFLVIGQLGFCCVYLVFVPTNIKQVIDYYHPNSPFSIQILMAIVLGPLILFCMVKDLKILAPFSTFANCLMIFSMGFILVEIFFSGPLKPLDQLEMVASFKTWPIYFSSAIYAFEGISLVLPVYHEMREKSRFATLSGVLNTAMTLVAIMYFSIGFFGYMKYGADSAASITLNLPSDSVVFQLVKIFFAVAIFISYNLQFYVAAEIIWMYVFNSSKWLQSLQARESSLQALNEAKPLHARKEDGESTTGTTTTPTSKKCISFRVSRIGLLESLFRTGMVLFTFALAIIVPRIDLFISLVGAVASSTLAIIIPPILDFVVFYNGSSRTAFRFTKNVLIILFGLYIFISGTYVSMSDIIKYLFDKK